MQEGELIKQQTQADQAAAGIASCCLTVEDQDYRFPWAE